MKKRQRPVRTPNIPNVTTTTHHKPDIEYDIGGIGERTLTGGWGILVLVPSTNLIERCTDDDNAKEYVEVVLCWTTTEGRLWLEAVDDVANGNLDNVEDEECKSKALGHDEDKYNEEFRWVCKHTV